MPPPQQNEAPPPATVFPLRTKPGVRRDGTVLDSQFYSDAIWTRFQRGLPRKMAGYKLIANTLEGAPRSVFVSAGTTINAAHVFSTRGVDKVTFDIHGGGGGATSRSPSPAMTFNDQVNWQATSLFDSGGSGQVFLIASAAYDAENIADETPGGIYYGGLDAATPLVPVADGSGPITTAGGVCVLQPFLFVYGADGLIRNSNANDISVATGWSGGLTNTANVAATKIVKGLPMRGGGQSPAGLFWALDSLIRVTLVNDGTVVWRYDSISTDISIMGKNAVVEYNGIFFWPGVDRFFMYNGTVQELPNDMNLNFFLDNINRRHANKMFGFKVPHFGEIWWVFPFGDATEPNHAIIFNVREGVWYDTPIGRSAGASPQVFRAPVLAGGDERPCQIARVLLSGILAVGQNVQGATSGAQGRVVRVEGAANDEIYIENTSAARFQLDETIVTVAFAGGSGLIIGLETTTLNSIWMHETGTDRVYLDEVTAIPSAFETDRFNFMSGGPGGGAPAGPNVQTRITRIEPDFVQTGGMTVTVRGTSYANSPVVTSEPYVFDPSTEKIDLREQRRQLSLRFESNVAGGDYQMGHVQITLAPGDARG